MRRRYLSLVAAPGLTEAHLLIYENEAKWASSNPPNSSPSTTPSPNRTSPQLLSPAPLQTIEQFLQADDGSRKGAKYLVRLEGLFYAGINHVGVNGRLSVTAVIKSALGKLVVGSSKSQDLTSSGHHHHQQQKETKKKDAQQQQKSGAVSSEVAGSAVSWTLIFIELVVIISSHRLNSSDLYARGSPEFGWWLQRIVNYSGRLLIEQFLTRSHFYIITTSHKLAYTNNLLE